MNQKSCDPNQCDDGRKEIGYGGGDPESEDAVQSEKKEGKTGPFQGHGEGNQHHQGEADREDHGGRELRGEIVFGRNHILELDGGACLGGFQGGHGLRCLSLGGCRGRGLRVCGSLRQIGVMELD